MFITAHMISAIPCSVPENNTKHKNLQPVHNSCKTNMLEGPLPWESCLNMFHSGNLLKTCNSDRSPSEARTACQKIWWVITRARIGVFFPISGEDSRLQTEVCLSLSAWKQKFSRHVISKYNSQSPIRLANRNGPSIVHPSPSVHHCLHSCLHSVEALPAQVRSTKRKIYILQRTARGHFQKIRCDCSVLSPDALNKNGLNLKNLIDQQWRSRLCKYPWGDGSESHTLYLYTVRKKATFTSPSLMQRASRGFC